MPRSRHRRFFHAPIVLSTSRTSFATLAALCALTAPCAVALADRVIDRYPASLTTYKAASATATQGVRPNVVNRAVNIDGSGNWPQAAAVGGGVIGGVPGQNPGSPVDPGYGDPNLGGGDPPSGRGGGSCGGGLPKHFDKVAPEVAAASAPSAGGVDLATGSWRPEMLDLALASPGFPWRIARSYSSAQVDSGGTPIDSNGYQGRNWFQSSQPEIVFQDEVNDATDMIYVVWGAAAYTEFVRNDTGVNVFKSKNGANATIEYLAGSPDKWVLTTPDGNEIIFFGGNTASNAANWQLWKITDPAGNVAYVGDSSSAGTAVTNGYSAGKITTAYDSADRRYTYTYSTLDSVSRLTQVKAETKSGGSWASPTGLVEVAKVDYVYYVSGDSDIANGTAGDLKLVTVTTPLTDSGVSRTSRQYFRYWKSTWSSGNLGQAHLVMHALDSEGCRRYSLSNSTLFAATDAQIKPYAQSSFEYDSSRRVTKTWGYGACGCGGGANGASEITYNPSSHYSNDASAYDSGDEWKDCAVVKRPDGTWLTQYIDEVGQSLSRIVTVADPATSPSVRWVSYVSRDDTSVAALDGFVSEMATPENVTAYSHLGATPFTRSSTVGIVRTFVREAGGSSDRLGLLLERRQSNAGTGGTQYLEWSRTFVSTDPSLTIGTGSGTSIIGLRRPTVATTRNYTQAISSGTTGSNETTFTSVFWTGSAATRVKSVTVTLPAVATANNGENTTHTQVTYVRKDGTPAFTKSPDGIYTYTQFTNGQLVKRIDDCVLNYATDFKAGDDPNTEFGITVNGNGLRQITTLTYDAQGRTDTVTMHAHGTTDAQKIVRKNYYTQLSDGKDLVLSYADYVAGGTPTYYGPIGCTVMNHAGSAEAQATVAISQSGITTALASHIDENQSDLIAAIDIGSVARLSTSVFDDSGHQRTESRGYFVIPSSLPGTEGTHYDATKFAYDSASRLIRTKSPDGTITRTYFDSDKRPYLTKIGTNDITEPSGESSGTNNMTPVSEQVYDSVGRLTDSKAYYDGPALTPLYRTTSYLYDADGRVVVTLPPASPYSVRKYDHLGRTVAEGLYSSSSGLSATTDPTATTSTNRIALSETAYDERGRAWKTTRHEITQANGNKASSLLATHWFDSAGREIKSDGEQLAKTFYDRLGRATHRFTLAKDNDSAYADADDVSGDIVLEEQQTIYDSVDGNVLMSVSIERRHDDYRTGETTGALDTNADGVSTTLTAADVDGRPSITSMWYDDLDRATATAAYGTNGGSTFTRPSTAPSSSSTVLVSTTSFNDDGTVLETTDPRGKKRRTLTDALGRTTATISNYVNGTPSSATGDDDNYIRQAYANGLRTKYWVDIDGDGVEDAGVDQVTTYTYGVSRGTSAGDSKIAANNMLQKVTYPDSSGGSDVVTYAYDTSRAQIWRKDQAGTVVETDYDSGGRREHERVTTFGSGIDQAVKRITTAYDSHGRAITTTCYDNATAGSGSVVNEVSSGFDGWGNLTSFKVDPDSVIAGSGGVPTKEISYTYTTATSGRNTIRRTGVTLPGSTAVSYIYGTGTTHAYADEASRLEKMEISSVSIAKYDYLGFGNVVGIEYLQPDVYQRKYGTTSGTWPDLDVFGRVIKSRWTKDLSTDMDFFSLDLSYDENSNPLTTEDNIYAAGFDVKYAIDGLDRLTDADEGTLASGAIGSRTRRQEWPTLSQTGNWNLSKLDLNGDAAWAGTNEYNDTRAHNVVNEIETRDTDTNGTANYTLTHDAAGNMTDDGKDYTYVYDAWYRLRQIKNRSTSAVVSEHQYYGNGFRAGEHYDSDVSGTVDGSDKWFWFGYDERWRIVGTYRDTDANPKERFLHHTAGASGYGSSSYIDDLVLRERDANTSWNGTAGDGTLEERLYYCQNWRHDIVALVTSAGALRERARYFSYGIPFGIPLGDCDGDGDADSVDQSILLGAWSTNTPKADLDLSGTIDAGDQSIQLSESGATAGWEVLSRNRNRFGHTGHIADVPVNFLSHSRQRVLAAGLGRWKQRDWIAAANLYLDRHDGPIARADPSGAFDIVFAPVSNKYGGCGMIDCQVTGIVEFQATNPLDRYMFSLGENAQLVAEIQVDWTGECCTGGTTATAHFFEKWGDFSDATVNQWELAPDPAWWFTAIGHAFTSPSLDALYGSYDARVVALKVVGMVPPPGGTFWKQAGTYPPVSFCNTPITLDTNEWSSIPPLGWTMPMYTYPYGSLEAHSKWKNCCGTCEDEYSGCASTYSATCKPGPDPTCP